jgi:hypothetical protein
MQMIAAQREKHSVLSTITALSDALTASAALGPPTPQMENLLAKALDGLQQFINADPIADPPIG